MRFGIANSALWATRDDRGLERLGQLDARLVHAARRLVPMWLMQLGEVVFGGVGSGLYGMLDVRDRRGVHRRADGRAHAGVSRQEDRGLRDQDGVARDAGAAAVVLVGTAIASVMPRRHGERRAIPARTASPRSSTRSRRPATTTAARSPGCPPTRRSTTSRSASRCGSSRYWLMIPVLAIAGSLAAKRATAVTAGTLPTHTPLFIVDAGRRRADGRRADVRAGARARARSSSTADDRRK